MRIGLGSAGGGVGQIQRTLTDLGFDAGDDRFFGKRTATAVAAFQESRGIIPHGVVDSKTAQALGLGHLINGSTAVGSSLDFTEVTDAISEELGPRFTSPDDSELRHRQRRLRALFASVPPNRTEELHAWLGQQPNGNAPSPMTPPPPGSSDAT